MRYAYHLATRGCGLRSKAHGSGVHFSENQALRSQVRANVFIRMHQGSWKNLPTGNDLDFLCLKVHKRHYQLTTYKSLHREMCCSVLILASIQHTRPPGSEVLYGARIVAFFLHFCLEVIHSFGSLF